MLCALLDPGQTVAALQENRAALVKLHGDARIPESRTFTALEYEASYGTSDAPGMIAQLATVVYTNRPLLFVGCSLTTDRTLASLKVVHRSNPYLVHYAILAAPLGEEAFAARRRDLEESGIRALWYRPGDFAEVGRLIDQLIARTAVDEIPDDPDLPPAIASAPAPSSGRKEWWPDLPIEPAVDALLSGRLAFFLGSAIHPGGMRGTDFYYALGRQAGVPWPTRDRADVAQHIADMDRSIGRRRLGGFIEAMLAENFTQPGPIHDLLSRLPRMLGNRSHAPLLILTTNQDDVLETAFDRAGEPYHLFLYQHDGLHAGRFLRRDPDGREFSIRRPIAVASVTDPNTFIVKLDGGLDPRRRWRPPSFVVSSADFQEVATRLPDLLPQVICNRLRECSLLFWGHGMAEPHVRALARCLRQQPGRETVTSWAVQIFGADRDYWRVVAGIDIVDVDLSVFVDRFEAALGKRLSLQHLG